MGACQKDPVLPTGGSEESPTPTQMIKHFQLQDIQNGLKSMTLESIEARLWDLEHVAELEKPFVTFYKKGTISSTLRAPKGKVQTDTHEINAWGGVFVVTPDSSTLKTKRLRFEPRTQKLLSDDDVVLEKPDSITTGHGLETDPDLQRIKIGHEKVRLKLTR